MPTLIGRGQHPVPLSVEDPNLSVIIRSSSPDLSIVPHQYRVIPPAGGICEFLPTQSFRLKFQRLVFGDKECRRWDAETSIRVPTEEIGISFE